MQSYDESAQRHRPSGYCDLRKLRQTDQLRQQAAHQLWKGWEECCQQLYNAHSDRAEMYVSIRARESIAILGQRSSNSRTQMRGMKQAETSVGRTARTIVEEVSQHNTVRSTAFACTSS